MSEYKGRRDFNVMAVRGESELLLPAIEQGAVDINEQDQFGYTFLSNAVSWRKYDLAKALIEAGADVNLVCRDGETALTFVARDGDIETIKMLVEHGADLHATNGLGDTALHYTALFGNQEAMSYLLEQGANVNKQNNAGQTPLHTLLAIRGSSEDLYKLTKIITSYPIDPKLKSYNDQTVTDLAAELPLDIQKMVSKGIARFNSLENKRRGQKMSKAPNGHAMGLTLKRRK